MAPITKRVMTTLKGILSGPQGHSQWWIVAIQPDSSCWVIMIQHGEASRFTMMNHNDSSWWVATCIVMHHHGASWWFVMMKHDTSPLWIIKIHRGESLWLIAMNHHDPSRWIIVTTYRDEWWQLIVTHHDKSFGTRVFRGKVDVRWHVNVDFTQSRGTKFSFYLCKPYRTKFLKSGLNRVRAWISCVFMINAHFPEACRFSE